MGEVPPFFIPGFSERLTWSITAGPPPCPWDWRAPRSEHYGGGGLEGEAGRAPPPLPTSPALGVRRARSITARGG